MSGDATRSQCRIALCVGVSVLCSIAGPATAEPARMPAGVSGRFTVEYHGLEGARHVAILLFDRQTGCRYLVFTSKQGIGMTPLLRSDGQPDCSK